jgi:hypothetical protein
MSVYLLLASSSITEWVVLLLWKKMVWSGILWPWSVLALYWSTGLHSLASHALFLHAGINLLLDFLLMCLYLRLDLSNSLGCLVLFKLKKRLLFDSIEMLPLNLFNLLFIVFMKVLHLFDILRNVYFLAVYSVLMSLVEVSLFSQLFPR